MAEKLAGDALIEFGFRRIVEELQELRGAVTSLTAVLNAMEKDREQEMKYIRAAGATAEKIEHYAFIANDTLLAMSGNLEKIQYNTFTTEMNVIRIEQALIKEETDNAKLGGV